MNFNGLFLSGGKGIKTDAVKMVIPLAVIFVLGPVLTANQSILMELAVFIILADALNIVYGFTGYLPFGFGAFFAVGAYGTAIMIAHYSSPVALALLVGALLACLLALVFTPLLRLSGAYFAIASLAAFEVVYLAVSNTSLTSVTGGPYGISFIQAYSPNVDYAVTAVVAIVSALAVILLSRSYFGIALKAIKEDRFAVELAGVNSLRYRNYAWLLSALFSGLAGGLFGWYLGFFYPEAVFSLTDYSVLVIVFVLFGGRGTTFGPVIGTIILFATYEMLILYFSNLLLIIFGLLLVLLILFIPDGILPIIRKYYGGIS
ncbi:MAG: branched-chain amino acid ABC transporter permease [Thermoplasmata archaeon]|nr:branched-chain amino acid ABC transporter permease [Candidatus Sysuiplasma acidicola]MBX8647050.1 branched-chain amino acid ABC transporter permease [Candidatus Sysuiplasma acidicola]MDH2905806.1 branched-chain amino acid ABC transporter permease [Methanomassiliicoccales archaeon]